MTTMTATTTQVYQVFIKASPEQIWEAITKPEFTSRYRGSLVDSTFEAGAPYRSWSPDREKLLVDAKFSTPIRRGGSATRGGSSTTRRRRLRSRAA
jgi:uncharacterized protein YndB with AHSA1/START domain